MTQFETEIRQARQEQDNIVIVEFNGAHAPVQMGNAGGHFAGYAPPEGAIPDLPAWLAKKAGRK